MAFVLSIARQAVTLVIGTNGGEPVVHAAIGLCSNFKLNFDSEGFLGRDLAWNCIPAGGFCLGSSLMGRAAGKAFS
jgi:hypothetical protein